MGHKHKPEIAKIGDEILAFNRGHILTGGDISLDLQIAKVLTNLHHVAAREGFDWKKLVGKAGRYFQADFEKESNPAKESNSQVPDQNDHQYYENVITEVFEYDNGWDLYHGGLAITCPNDQCKVAPKPGEILRLYGRGDGYPVRGLVIKDRVYRYQTEEDYSQNP